MEYFACQDDKSGWLFVFALHGGRVKCIGPTQDLPPDCLDFRNSVEICDDSGEKRRLYRVSVPLEIEDAAPGKCGEPTAQPTTAPAQNGESKNAEGE